MAGLMLYRLCEDGRKEAKTERKLTVLVSKASRFGKFSAPALRLFPVKAGEAIRLFPATASNVVHRTRILVTLASILRGSRPRPGQPGRGVCSERKSAGGQIRSTDREAKISDYVQLWSRLLQGRKLNRPEIGIIALKMGRLRSKLAEIELKGAI